MVVATAGMTLLFAIIEAQPVMVVEWRPQPMNADGVPWYIR
jgi:hypothetical protein